MCQLIAIVAKWFFNVNTFIQYIGLADRRRNNHKHRTAIDHRIDPFKCSPFVLLVFLLSRVVCVQAIVDGDKDECHMNNDFAFVIRYIHIFIEKIPCIECEKNGLSCDIF